MTHNIADEARRVADEFYKASQELHEAVLRFGRDGDTQDNRKNYSECWNRLKQAEAALDNFLNGLTK